MPSSEPQSWLARLLRIRPARRLSFLTGPKAQSILRVRDVLTAWQAYGVQDVLVARRPGYIEARVVANNALRARPVALRFEFYAMRRAVPRRAGLGAGVGPGARSGRPHAQSLAVEHYTVLRVVQVQGARSSFVAVVAAVGGAVAQQGGRAIQAFLALVAADITAGKADPATAEMAGRLERALGDLQGATLWDVLTKQGVLVLDETLAKDMRSVFLEWDHS